MKHPFGLSNSELRVIAGITEHGTPEKAASELGINNKSLYESLRRVRTKMGVNSTLLAAVKWDRWARDREAKVSQ